MSKKLFLLFSALASTTASHLRTDPLLDDTKLEVLATTAKVIDKELRLLEHENRPQLLSSWIGKYQHKLGTAATAAPTQQRFEAAVSVPDACPAECKSAWTKLSDIYAKYYECTPKCDEEFLSEKTQTSEAVDESCMVEQQCWEAIEEVIFTKSSGSESVGADNAESEQTVASAAGDAVGAVVAGVDGALGAGGPDASPALKNAVSAVASSDSVSDAMNTATEMGENGALSAATNAMNAGKDELAKHGAAGALANSAIGAGVDEISKNGLKNMNQEGAQKAMDAATNTATAMGKDELEKNGVPGAVADAAAGAAVGAAVGAAGGAAGGAVGSAGSGENKNEPQESAVGAAAGSPESAVGVPLQIDASGNEIPPDSTQAETGACKDQNDCSDGQVCTLGEGDRKC